MDRPEKAMVFGGGKSASGGGDSTLRTSNSGEAIGRNTKSLLTREFEAVENTNKDKTARHKKSLEQWLWYHVRDIEWIVLYFTCNKTYMTAFI